MTVTSETKIVTLPGTGTGSTNFTYDFDPIVIQQTSDLYVVISDSAGVETVLTEGTGASNYSVSAADVFPGTGTITYPADQAGGTELVATSKIHMRNRPPVTQATDFRNRGAYLAQNIENALDKLTMNVQEMEERLSRAITIPVSQATLTDLETDQPTASQYIRTTSDNTGVEWVDGDAGEVTDATTTTTATAAVTGVSTDYSRADHVHLDGALAGDWTYTGDNVWTGSATFNKTNNDLLIKDTTDDATQGPDITMWRNRGIGTVANLDIIGSLNFKADTDASTSVVYANIFTQIKDKSDGAHSSIFKIRTKDAGTNRDVIISEGSMLMPTATGGQPAVGVINAAGLEVNGGDVVTEAGTHTLAGNNTYSGTMTVNDNFISSQSANIYKIIDTQNVATQGPDLHLYKNRGAGNSAAADIMGGIYFKGDTSTTANVNMAQILAKIVDATHATRSTSLTIRTVDAAVNRDIVISEGSVLMPTATGGQPAVGVINAADLEVNGVAVATSDGTTAGIGRAGIGNEYVEITCGGTTYKVLHDGIVS